MTVEISLDLIAHVLHLTENELGRHVIFKFVSVMASSEPLKNTGCLKILLPYVRSQSELVLWLELTIRILLGKRPLIDFGTVSGKYFILCINTSAFFTIIP